MMSVSYGYDMHPFFSPRVVPPSAPIERQLLLSAQVLLPRQASILELTNGGTNASETPAVRATMAAATHAVDFPVDMFMRRHREMALKSV